MLFKQNLAVEQFPTLQTILSIFRSLKKNIYIFKIFSIQQSTNTKHKNLTNKLLKINNRTKLNNL